MCLILKAHYISLSILYDFSVYTLGLCISIEHNLSIIIEIV